MTVCLVGLCFNFDASSAPNLAITVMTFNVENLYDTKHDIGYDDYTYLPLSIKAQKFFLNCRAIAIPVWRKRCLTWDWNEQILHIKMQKIAHTILAYNQGQGPDILVLQEVENRKVVEKLRSNYLAAAKYRSIAHIENRDPRGIDVAVISRFPKAFPEKFHHHNSIRPVLEASFDLGPYGWLKVHAVHLPSQIGERKPRLKTLSWIKAIAEKSSYSKNISAVIVAGDFNIPSGRISNGRAAQHSVFDVFFGKANVAHLAGCNGCFGTYFFRTRKKWSFFDTVILVSKCKAYLDPKGIRVIRTIHNSQPISGIPRRFEVTASNRATGVSDHLPLVSKIILSETCKP